MVPGRLAAYYILHCTALTSCAERIKTKRTRLEKEGKWTAV